MRVVLPQPRSQGLSSYRLGRARRDPGWVRSRVFQNLGDDNQSIEGRGGLVRILSIIIIATYIAHFFGEHDQMCFKILWGNYCTIIVL